MERKATFGAGCFWGVEAAFRQLDGVTKTRVGYTGGHTENPTYEDVCSHGTGHAEVVEVTYDDERLSLRRSAPGLLGQARPDAAQSPGLGHRRPVPLGDLLPRRGAAGDRDPLEGASEQARHKQPVVTQIEPAQTFFEAEDYHQQYLEKRGRSSCTPALRTAVG